MVAQKEIQDGIEVRNARYAVTVAIKAKELLNQPIARFDPQTKKVFMERSDGSTIVVGTAMQRGRYSERSKYKA